MCRLAYRPIRLPTYDRFTVLGFFPYIVNFYNLRLWLKRGDFADGEASRRRDLLVGKLHRLKVTGGLEFICFNFSIVTPSFACATPSFAGIFLRALIDHLRRISRRARRTVHNRRFSCIRQAREGRG